MRKIACGLNCLLFACISLSGYVITDAVYAMDREELPGVQTFDVSSSGTLQVKNYSKTRDDIALYVEDTLKIRKKHDRGQLYGILMTALRDDDMEVRAATASALGTLGNEAVIPDLLSTLKDEDMWVRLAAATGLGDIDEKSVIPELIRLLSHDNSQIREAAALALGAIDYSGEIPGLKEAIDKKEIDPRIADYLLGKTDSMNDKDIQDLKRKLRDKSDMYARIVAVLAFGKIGKVNDKVIPDIEKALLDNEPIVRALAVVVLSRLEHRESLGFIKDLANDDDSIVRGAAALAMGKLGDSGTLASLERLTKDNETSVRASAALGIGKLGNIAGIPALEWLLLNNNDKDNIAVELMSVASLWNLTK